MYSLVNTATLLAVHLLHVNFTQQYSSYVYFVTTITALTHHRQTTISLTLPNFADDVKFPNFFSWVAWVATPTPIHQWAE